MLLDIRCEMLPRKKRNPIITAATLLGLSYVLGTPEGQEILKEITRYLKAKNKEMEKDEQAGSK